MVMGMAMKVTEKKMATAETLRPAHEAGVTSPYPTVEKVTSINHTARDIVSNGVTASAPPMSSSLSRSA